MTIPLTGTGGIFTRIGVIGGLLNSVNASVGATAPSGTPTWGSTIPILAAGPGVTAIYNQYLAADQSLPAGLYAALASFRTTPSSLASYLQSLAVATLQTMVNDDVPQKIPTSTYNCMAELIRQMNASSNSVTKPTVSATPASIVATGDTVFLASVIGTGGVQRDYIFVEVVNAICTATSLYTSSYSDTYSVLGNPLASGPLNWDYPAGSGASTSLSSCDANSVGTQLLTNPFQTFISTPNLPDSWTAQIGAAGTDFFAGGPSASYFGVNCLQITGTASALLDELRQTLTTLQPSTVYAINAWVKATGSLAAGVLEFDLYDTVGAAVLTDASSNACSVSVAHGTLTTSYQAINGFIRTPAILPNNGSSIAFRVKVTTALTSGQSVYIDRVAIQAAQDIYGTGGGGPFVAAFAGKTRAAVNDKYTITTANTAYTSPNVAPTFQRTFEQLFGMKSLGLQLPSSGSPTIADTLIT